MYEKFVLLLSKSNKTTYQVAKATKLSPTLFSDWKNGRSKPKADKLKIIANYFEVPIEFFLE